MTQKFKGLLDQYERKPQYRDTRGLSQRVGENLKNPSVVLYVFIGLSAGVLLVPFIPFLVWIVGAFWLYRRSMAQHSPYPLRMPKPENRLDYNSPPPGKDGGASMADGIAYLGDDIITKKQIWLTNSDLRQHLFYIATTGGGKSEALISLIANAFAWGSGFCFIDGKADTGLYGKVYSLARRFGREDDIRVINYLSGGKDDNISSNTMNPIATGSSRMIQSLLESLMDGGGQGGSDMWKGRAIVLMNAVVRALVSLRDENGFSLDVLSLRDYMALDKVMELAARTDLPKVALLGIRGYLSSLPGFKFNMPYDKQQPQTLEQHGYLQMQFTRTFGDFAETYGKIFGARISDVDMEDIVINRRILIVMLPALELSLDGLKQTGKIVVANLKAMMARCLGSQIEGSHADIFEGKPSTCETPFMIIQDECGYYLPDDAPLMAAQARSLGISLTYATQEIASLKSSLGDKADQIVGNTSSKFFGKIEDPNETMRYIMERAAHGNAVQKKSFRSEQGMTIESFNAESSAAMERVERVDKRDLYNQREGEYHMFFYDRIFRMRAFYADPPPVKRYVFNKMIAISPPSEEEIRILEDRVEIVIAALRQPGALASSYPATPEFAMAAHILRSKDIKLGMAERAAAVIAAIGLLEDGAELPGEFGKPQSEDPSQNVASEVLDGNKAVEAVEAPEQKPVSEIRNAAQNNDHPEDSENDERPIGQQQRVLRRAMRRALDKERSRVGFVDRPRDESEEGDDTSAGDNAPADEEIIRPRKSVLQTIAAAGDDDDDDFIGGPSMSESGSGDDDDRGTAERRNESVSKGPPELVNDSNVSGSVQRREPDEIIDYSNIANVAEKVSRHIGVSADKAKADAQEVVARIRDAHIYPKEPIPKKAVANKRVVGVLKNLRKRVQATIPEDRGEKTDGDGEK